MYTFMIILFLLVSVLMVIIILLQASKGGGLASSFGGMGASGGVLGARGASSFLQKTTVVLGLVFAGLCLIISLMSAPSSGDGAQETATQRRLNQEAAQQQQMLPPLTPDQIGNPDGAANPTAIPPADDGQDGDETPSEDN